MMSSLANHQDKESRKPRSEQRRLDDLRPFPLQRLLEGTTTPIEDQELENDIAQNGLRDPIHILPTNKAGLPENTILDGFRRLRALRALKRKVVLVIVRNDLADVDADKIHAEFFRYSLMRRQLSPLAKARMAKGLVDAQRKPLGDNSNGEVRDRVGELIGMSGRNLVRHWAVLRATMEIQSAFEQKKLSLVEAERISRLAEEKQRDIARRILQGEPPKKAVVDYLPKKQTGHVKPNDAFVAFMKSTRRGVSDLKGRVNRVSPRLLAEHERHLREARRLFHALIDGLPPSHEDETAGW